MKLVFWYLTSTHSLHLVIRPIDLILAESTNGTTSILFLPRVKKIESVSRALPTKKDTGTLSASKRKKWVVFDTNYFLIEAI